MSSSPPHTHASQSSKPPKTIIFIGCGHSTSLLIQSLISSHHKLSALIHGNDSMHSGKVRFIMLNDSPFSVYSGMIPGVCGNQYNMKQAMLAVKPFFEAFLEKTGIGADNGTVICAKLLKIDKERKEIVASTTERENQFYWKGLDTKDEREESDPNTGNAGRTFVLKYDVLMLNIGSQTKGKSLLGDLAHEVNVLPTRPISHLPIKVTAYENTLRQEAREGAKQEKKLIVVGDGAAGFELCCVIHERYSKEFSKDEYVWNITLIGSHDSLADASGDKSLGSYLNSELHRRNVTYINSTKVVQVNKSDILTNTGRTLPYHLLVWAIGADPIKVNNGDTPGEKVKLFKGFFESAPTLQNVSEPCIFSVGDCAFLEKTPWVPKAGVYSVRMAPVAKHNLMIVLEALLQNQTVTVPMKGMKEYDPQKKFLRIYNVGNGTAIGIWKGFAQHGRASWWLKNWIDTKFMLKFHAARVESDEQVKELCVDPHSKNWELFVDRWEGGNNGELTMGS